MLLDNFRKIVEPAGDCEGEEEEAKGEAEVALFVVRNGVDSKVYDCLPAMEAPTSQMTILLLSARGIAG